jgi:succinate dehydrogenase hydrophobic anchor subunit
MPDLKKNTHLGKYPLKISKKKTIYLSPKIPALFFLFLFLFIGFLPIITHYTGVDTILNDNLKNVFADSSSPFAHFQDYKTIMKEGGDDYEFGPYGVYPALLSLFIPMGLAFSIGYYFQFKYSQFTSMRDKTKKLEVQFPSATFQLGNRINEGLAAELAFGAVSETMKGTEAGEFFSKIDSNVKFEGMGVESAIFDKEKGAINAYPSDLIVSSMKILVRAIEKGPEITAKTLMDLSRYLSEIHMAGERMRDLLAESIGSMKGQASFLAPVISGVVIAIVSLVTMIMGTLSKATGELASEEMSGMPNFLGESIPTFLLQSVVGVYIVLLIIILVYVVTNLENGEDSINTRYQIGQKVKSGFIKYFIVVAIGVILFAYIGASILKDLV